MRIISQHILEKKMMTHITHDFEFSLDKEETYDEKLQLQIKNVPRPFINSLLRVIMENTASMRIDKRWFGPKNTIQTCNHSGLDLQFGFIPIDTNPDLFKFEYEIDDDNNNNGKQNASWKPPYEPDYIINDRMGHGIYGRPHYPKEGSFSLDPPPLPDERTTLVFELDIKCYFDPNLQNLVNQKVFSHDLKWIPIGNQEQNLKQANCIPRILPFLELFTLSENEQIHVILHAVKGAGYEHTKWRSVNCYFYDVNEQDENADMDENCVKFVVESLNYPINREPRYYLETGLKLFREIFIQLDKDLHVSPTNC